MTQPARGMRDFLPDDLRRREYVVGVIRKVYELYGFEPLETPAVENIETLLGKAGEESNKLIFKILKRGEREATGEADLALRYDLTVPLARVVAEYQAKLPKFFKRYQIQPVWRADRPARGRFREFYQCDVDIVGTSSLLVEVELCSAVSDVLTLLGFQNFSIRLNHRATLIALLTAVGINKEQHDDALVATDKFDKIGQAGVQAELERKGIDSKAAASWSTFLQASPVDHSGGNSEWIGRARELTARLQRHDGLDELSTILSLAEATTAAGRIRFDPTLARGLSYYTGAIMEVAVPDLAGSLGGGGRYDNLIGQFLGRDIPACGFSLGLERILVVMTERNMFPESMVRGSADVMVTIWSDELKRDALELATALRTAGIRVDVYPEAGKIPLQFKYASSRNYPFVAVVGDDERQNRTVTVRHMRSRKQDTVARAEVCEFLKGLLTKDAE